MKKRFIITLLLSLLVLPLAADDIADHISKIKWASCFIQDPAEFGYHTVLEFPVLNTPQKEETAFYRFVLERTESNSLRGSLPTYKQKVHQFTNNGNIYQVPNISKRPYTSDITLRESATTFIDRYKDISNLQFDYWVRITDPGNWMQENGIFPLQYDESTKTFYSIPVLENTVVPLAGDTFIESTDEFSFQIIGEKPLDELLLFRDYRHQRVFFPIEQLLFTGSQHFYLKSKGKLYVEPSFDSEFVYYSDMNSSGGFQHCTVIERTNEWIEKDDRLSIWVKIQQDDGVTGWVWGPELQVYESRVLPADSPLYQEIRKQELILYPQGTNFTFTEIKQPGKISRKVDLCSSWIYNDPPFRTLQAGDEVTVINLIDYTRSAYAFVECSDGQQGWIRKDAVTYPSDNATTKDEALKSQAKILKASFNLRLRKREFISSDIVTTMQKGTTVKIITTGSQETIDGITGNWVEVEVQPGSKDSNGNSIPAGTTGWCFSGYLE